ncbi:MAG: 1-acyl-sn-glycerol-3-phosphate acyltransferase [Colwelliaceae bacterium]|nr:1-acyl-sn-glycerol-3-phosphate acyltransferase [Colwelliaceae bacterium]
MNKKILNIREKTIFDGVFTKYFLKSIFSVWFKLAGWTVTKTSPQGAGVAIAAPHTSNWDFLYALGSAILQDIKIYFSIKDSWCHLPLIGSFMMWLGAMPIDRSSKGKGQVELIKAFVAKQKNEKVFFLFTPEGTRGKSDKWKTGFYHVAQDCGIPIFLSKVDYLIKEAGVFHSYTITGDKEDDIKAIQASYKRIAGKFIDKQYPHYEGSLPKITDAEAIVMKAIYSFKGVATRVDIAAKVKRKELSASMLEFLIEKGILEKTNQKGDDVEPCYHLTFLGKGCLLHLYPSLA